MKTMVDHLKKYLKLEFAFLAIFIGFGLFFVFMTPPGQNADEPNHTYRVWQFTHFNLFADSSPSGDIGGLIPVNLQTIFLKSGINHVFDTNYKFNSINYHDLYKLGDSGAQTFVGFPNTAQYSPAAYLPYFPASFIGIIFHLPFLVTFYLMRISSLIFVAILLFVAIRIIPVGKWVIAIVGLLPSTIAQASSVTADAMTIALGIFTIAYIFFLFFNKVKPTIRQGVILVALFTVLVLTKVTYALIPFLVLAVFIFNKEFRSKKGILIVAIPLFISIGFALVWFYETSYITTVGYSLANPDLQKAFIIHHPLLYLKVLYYTFFTNQAQPVLYPSFFGDFAWLTTPLAPLFMVATTVILTLSVFLTSTREKIVTFSHKYSIYLRLWLLILFGGSVIGIATALYLYSSSVDSSIITGIQGRYFLPIAPLLLLSFCGNSIRNQRSIKYGIITLTIITLTSALLVIHFRYYQVLPSTL